MLNFLKGIFTSNEPKIGSLNPRSENTIQLYFDRGKNTSLDIKLLKNHTCHDIQTKYHDDILSELLKTHSGSDSVIGKLINPNEYAFLIIDDENPYTELKLKSRDVPSNYLKKSSNLFYLNMNIALTGIKDECKINSYDFILLVQLVVNGQMDSSCGLNQNSSINFNGVMSLNVGLSSTVEIMREGELMKYSTKHKKFNKRLVTLDKEKLILTKPNTKDSTILLLSDLSSIPREITDKSIKDKYTFEIITYEGDHYILKAKNNGDLETWIEYILTLVQLIRDNKFFLKYTEQSAKYVKESYEKAMKIIYNCLSLKGILSLKESRYLFYNQYNNQQISDIMESVINFKTSMYYYKYFEAWTYFEEVMSLLNIESFDVNLYFSFSEDDTQVGHKSRDCSMENNSSVCCNELTTGIETTLSSTDDNTPAPLQKNKNFKSTLIRMLLSYDTLRFLKELKTELKEVIEKCQHDTDHVISTGEINNRLHDYLKPALLNEIYENLINKIFHKFYKTVISDPIFKARLENILLYSFKIKNKFLSQSLIDLELCISPAFTNNPMPISDIRRAETENGTTGEGEKSFSEIEKLKTAKDFN